MRFEQLERGEYVELLWSRSRGGRIGEARPRPFAPLVGEDAERKRIAELSSDGFVEAGAANVWDFQPAPELEARVREDPDDPARWFDYADWLAAHAQPELAELIREVTPAAGNAFSYQWLGDLHEWYRNLNKDWRGLPRELQAVEDRELAELKKVLHWPLCRFLERVDLCFDDHEGTLPVLLDWAGLDHLRALALWTEDDYGSDLPDLTPLWPRGQRLRSLAVVGGSEDGCMGDLSFPDLRHLARRAQCLPEQDLESLLTADCPRLEALTIGVGRAGSTIEAEAFAPLLSGRRFPQLRKLAIEQFDGADDFVELLAHSKLLPGLTHLSLFQSALSGRGATVLTQHASAFAHLAFFSVRETGLTEAEGADLFATLPVVGEHNAFLAPDDELYLFKNYQTRFWEEEPHDERAKEWAQRCAHLASSRSTR